MLFIFLCYRDHEAQREQEKMKKTFWKKERDVNDRKIKSVCVRESDTQREGNGMESERVRLKEGIKWMMRKREGGEK